MNHTAKLSPYLHALKEADVAIEKMTSRTIESVNPGSIVVISGNGDGVEIGL